MGGRAALEKQKGRRSALSTFPPGKPLLGGGGGSQGLDLGSQAALVASGLVLVEQTLVGDRVDRGLGRLEQIGGLRGITGGDGLLDVLDDGAELGAQRRIVR